MPDDGQQGFLSITVTVHFSMLNIDDADYAVRRRNDRHRKKRLVFVFRQVIEDFEADVLAGTSRDRNRLRLLCHPTRNSLADTYPNLSDQAGMRIFRGPENEMIRILVEQI